jgi:hypothetical protein
VSVVSRGQGYEVDSSSSDCVIRRVVPQPTEWQSVGNQIDAAMIFTRADFVKVLNRFHCEDHQEHVPLLPGDRQGTSVPSSTRVPRWQLLKVCASLGRFNHTSPCVSGDSPFPAATRRPKKSLLFKNLAG